MKRNSNKIKLIILASLWLVGITFGLHALWKYNTTPGRLANADNIWPEKSRVLFQKGKFNLVLILHPLCLCSKASLTEFEYILEKAGDNLNSNIVVLIPQGMEMKTEEIPFWKKINGHPKIRSIIDSTGIETENFKAYTSGQALLYSGKGELIFSGGITDSRGHTGMNSGVKRILELISGKGTDSHFHEVYGCGLQ